MACRPQVNARVPPHIFKEGHPAYSQSPDLSAAHFCPRLVAQRCRASGQPRAEPSMLPPWGMEANQAAGLIPRRWTSGTASIAMDPRVPATTCRAVSSTRSRESPSPRLHRSGAPPVQAWGGAQFGMATSWAPNSLSSAARSLRVPSRWRATRWRTLVKREAPGDYTTPARRGFRST